MADSTRSRHVRRLAGLKTERSYYESLWAEYDQFIAPGRFRLNERDKKGEKKFDKILDETGLYAFRTFRSGFQSGQTSPARPWFRLTTFDPDLREYGPVKEWLFQSETRMRQAMQASNIYNVLHNGYGDLGQFGQDCFVLVRDDISIFRALPMVTGQYWIAQNHRHRVDTLYREIQMTVEQVVGRFVHQVNGDMDWSRVSATVKNLWDGGSNDSWVKISHAIEPRTERDTTKSDKRNKRLASNYWEDGHTGDVMMEESGFSYDAIIASRWETTGEDVYASNHPGDITLPGIKMLQAEQRKKGIAIDKKVDPPVQMPTSMKMNPSSTLPGGVTYVDAVGNRKAIEPLYDVNFDISHLGADIKEVQDRIRVGWYEPLFMAISQMEGVQPRNVYELTQRKEEQLLQLGPVIDRQQYERLNPLIDGVFHIMMEDGLLPPPPKEIQGENLKVEHISILAQAQRAVATGSIERVTSFVGNLAAAKPDVLDKLDLDQSVDEYAEMVGAPPTIIRSDDAVAKIRADRAEAQQAQASAEMAAQTMPALKRGVEAAKLLTETGGQPSGGMVSTGDLLSRLGIA